MAVVKNLMVRAGADFSAITKQANKSKASMKSMESSVSKSCSRMTAAASGMKKAFAALGAAVSVTALVSAAKSAKAAYDEQAEASAKLAQVMQNTMGATAKQVQAIEDYIDAQERLGVVTGDVQTAGAQELATYLTMTSSLKKLIPVMNDMVAQQYGIGASAESAVSIATMLGKVMNGQTSALSRYGYTFDAAQEAVLKYGTEAQRAAVLAEVVGESVGGMNEALAATPNGRLQQVSNTLGKIQENFGQAINSVLVLFIPALNTLCGVLANVATLANKVAQTLANVFGAKSSGATKTVQYTGAMADSVGEVEEAAVSASKAMSNLMGFDQINKLTSSSSGGVSAADSGAGGSITESVEVDTSEAGESIGWLEQKLKDLQGRFAAIDTSKLTGALDRLKESAAPLKEAFFSGLSWTLDNVFVPLATWSTEGFLPTFLDTLGGAASVLGSTISTLQPGASWLWENFLQPVASWTGGVIVGVLEGLSGALYKVSDWISAHQGLVQGMAVTASAFCAAWGIGTLAEFLVTAAKAPASLAALAAAFKVATTAKVANKVAAVQLCAEWAVMHVKQIPSLISGLGKTAAAFAAKTKAVIAGSGAASAFGTVLSFLSAHPLVAIVGAIASVTAVVITLTGNWDKVKEAGSKAWESIKNAWSSASGWFTSSVIQPIRNDFKNFGNGIMEYFEGIVNGGISGVNKLIEAINKISFDVPEWVPVVGGKSFSFNLPTRSKVTLPRFGAGGIVSKATPAIIGEAGPEAVVPLSENAGWLDALASRIAALTNSVRQQAFRLTIPVYVGGRKVTEVVIDDINELIRTTGVCPINI